MKRPISILKELFGAFKTPTGSQFADLIDSFVHKDELQSSVGDAVAIEGNDLPELGSINKYAEVYGGTTGRTFTYHESPVGTVEAYHDGRLYWDGTAKTWEVLEKQERRKGDAGANGRTTEPFDPAISYTAGSQIYFGGSEIYTVLSSTTAGETPITHPSKFKLELKGGDDNVNLILKYFLGNDAGFVIDVDSLNWNQGQLKKNDGTFLTDAWQYGYALIDTSDYSQLLFDGFVFSTGWAPDGSIFSTILGVTESNSLVPIEPFNIDGDHIIQTYNVDSFKQVFINVKFDKKPNALSVANSEIVIPFENSVKEYIDNSVENATGGGGNTFIDAYSKYNVRPSNSPAVNTSGMNSAIVEAYLSMKKVVLPPGIINVTNIAYLDGVCIEGQGLYTTVLKGTTAGSIISNLDLENENVFHGGFLRDFTIDCNNIANVGIELVNFYAFEFRNLFIIKAVDYAMKIKGVLVSWFTNCHFEQSKNGFLIETSYNSSWGYMQANLINFSGCVFNVIERACMTINRGSNISFNHCNFENCGISGDDTTGGVIATDLSPANEGVDLSFNDCWSEGVRGTFLNLSNSKGITTISNTMISRAGNGAVVGGGKAIINNESKILITGGTTITGYETGVLTRGVLAETRVDGFARILNHTEEIGGVFKTAQFA